MQPQRLLASPARTLVSLPLLLNFLKFLNNHVWVLATSPGITANIYTDSSYTPPGELSTFIFRAAALLMSVQGLLCLLVEVTGMRKGLMWASALLIHTCNCVGYPT